MMDRQPSYRSTLLWQQIAALCPLADSETIDIIYRDRVRQAHAAKATKKQARNTPNPSPKKNGLPRSAEDRRNTKHQKRMAKLTERNKKRDAQRKALREALRAEHSELDANAIDQMCSAVLAKAWRPHAPE